MKKSTLTLIILAIAELFLLVGAWGLMVWVQSASDDPVAYAETAQRIFIMAGAVMGALGGFLLFQWYGQRKAEQ